MPKIVQPFTCACSVGKIALEGSGLTSLREVFSVSIDLLENQRQMYKELEISYWRPTIILIFDGTPTDNGDIAIPKLKNAFASKKYGLCVLGLPGYDENLFSALEVPHGLWYNVTRCYTILTSLFLGLILFID